MLLRVNGYTRFFGPQAFPRWLRLTVLAMVGLGVLLPAAPAFAQQSDGGWFDPPPTPEPAPSPARPEPASAPYPAEAPSAPQRVELNAAPTPVAQTDVEDTDPSALTTFRPALDPYGDWVNDSTYGTVWVPNRAVVGADFAPYVSRGRWALTADDDWIWQSDYPFGWAVFHYGRWVWISERGWSWVPGRTYANAWVVWRVPTAGHAYVGWAPMPPTWGWRYGYAYSLWFSPPLPYVFCPSAYIFHHRVHHHIVHDRRLVHDIASGSRVYPTPYRAPAQPTVRGAASPSLRPARIGPSAAPRGPAMSAARIPSDAVPAVRTAPPAAAMRVAPRTASVVREPFRSSARYDARQVLPRDSVRRSLPVDNRVLPRESVRRSLPSESWSSMPRPAARDRIRPEPRSVSPERMRVTPSTSRSFGPAPSRSLAPMRSFSPSPSRSLAPVRSFSPSFSPSRSFAPASPRMHGGGGGGRRR